MSRQFVRGLVTSFFTPPAVDFLNTIYPSSPKFAPGSDAFEGMPPLVTSGAVAWVDIGDANEKRIALGGPHSGKKLVVHNVTVLCGFWSVQAKLEDAEADHDIFVESFKQRLRSDRQIGCTNGQILEAGEKGGIRAKHDVLILNSNGASFRWTRFEFQVSEVLTT